MNEKRMLGIGISVILVILVLGIFGVATVNASGIQLLCLSKYQKVQFSKCNTAIRDWTCGSTTCQICVNQLESGVYCPANLNDCSTQTSCTEFSNQSDLVEPPLPENELPNLTLMTPLDGNVTKSANISFVLRVPTKSIMIDHCHLLIDGQEVTIKNSPISTTTTLKYYLNPGNYTWGIRCVNKVDYGGNIYESSSRTIIVTGNVTNNSGNNTGNNTGNQSGNNTTPFVPIVLLSPDSGFKTTNTSQNITFSFNISKTYNLNAIKSCNLTLNSNVTKINFSKTNTFNSLTVENITSGIYNWNIVCSNSTGVFSSENRTFEIGYVAPVIPPAASGGNGGGGGGGGGSSCQTNFTCTDWTLCINGTQTRTCTKDKASCVGTKPAEVMNCTVLSESEGLNETTNSSVIEQGVSGITGAVTGLMAALSKSKIYVAFGFVGLVVVIGAITFFFRKKKKSA